MAGEETRLFVPAALTTAFTGLLLLTTRLKAINQVLGYLVFENGIFVFGLSVVSVPPLLVELGILLDLFVAVFVMGIIVFHIQRTFDHIDVTRLSDPHDAGPQRGVPR
jgi:hydrogenase-4 component E